MTASTPLPEPQPIPDFVQSRAAIARHPIHPMLIPLPIASLVGVVVTDALFLLTANPFWSEASRYLLLAGAVTGAVAGVVGLIDLMGIRYVRSLMAAWIHAGGNVAVIGLAVINLMGRPADPQTGVAVTVTTGQFIFSLVILGILMVTGWLGGELSYRYRVGVMPRNVE